MTNNCDMKHYGFYRGKVLQLLNNGFCRIEIPGILEKINGDINSLPPAEPAQSIGGGGPTSSSGTFTYPDVDSIVWCFFEGGNLKRPVYFATSNAKSDNWDNVSVKTKKNENKGNEGITMWPTGHMIQNNNSFIRQYSSVDEQDGTVKSDNMDLYISATPEQEDLYTQEIENTPEKPAISNPCAAQIHMDNVHNMLVLSAKNEIILRAPKIIIDTTGQGQNGYYLLYSDEIDNMTPNGNFRVMTSEVNIDSGTNDILLFHAGEYHEYKYVYTLPGKKKQQ